ncbi:hypothetical protein ICW40_17630, partial [Actinotalea ferrariae]|nr:hypothetical protein [Actinotalea ferrariae]
MSRAARLRAAPGREGATVPTKRRRRAQQGVRPGSSAELADLVAAVTCVAAALRSG